ncbi:MAG: 50S ribosomal protein L1 [Microgenomates group bacterium GW2011_GWC1_44_37]|uniref:Ribosomal protein n=1 Tax=Candidatus Collierbacteria bacterium GW2011_GWB2_44_22 TaxID=1618387 RepID=A0A0G1HXW7_9BACT|nr:MAG: 50S ribosomal protein L1 [Candidatus Collierbacteria bacterium GW2011_GWB2_44_22]KKT61910.1 MAG: 50S ribosomal protein L1 [Candidatus Collierbacteria bacterium GW2011_GWD1_44_27]KKT65803.1 MAG: 50S ribosomal protein L1 [Candidatus Collierbacteria bacterium GW2011_GWC2_44_30]KKT68472.1 MAG: 50S ribosomal protein L1 [Microgenomates group bacterium GW2011_GWC1_44_37]KKT88109.1 MAG: 50S ribosomal protein L1 [Candidatus Collierbacteria bacterium GW2011_GWD2_45_10]
MTTKTTEKTIKKETVSSAKTTKQSTKKTSRINWDNLYLDLPTHVTEALRTARVKPEQIITKTDGELMAINGITEKDVESIRLLYNTDTVKDAVVTPVVADESVGAIQESPIVTKKPLPPKKRGKKYKLMAKDIKKDEMYSIEDAVAKLQKLSQSTKLKTVELTINTRETGLRGELKLPHSTGKELKIAIFSDQVAKDVEAGKIDFSILLATPADMPKLARLAKILGPKGLMPNPKSGTVTDNPEKRAADLAAGGTLPYKTEAKFPIIHLALGKSTQDAKDLAENITEALKAIGVTRIKNAYLSCTHTPSMKLHLGTL